MRKEFRGRLKGTHYSKVHMSYICMLLQMFGFSRFWLQQYFAECDSMGIHVSISEIWNCPVFCQLSKLDTLSCLQMFVAQFSNKLELIKSLAPLWMPWCVIFGEHICACLHFMDRYHFPYVCEFGLSLLFYRKINCFQAIPTTSLKIH